MNIIAHQEKEKNEETRTGKRRAGKERKQAPILKKLYAALLRSLRGQHNEKISGECPG